MREIKFRGKERTGEWITGGFVQKTGTPHIMAHIVDRGVDEWRAIAVLPDTVGQFTGLRDRNGVEIYEGDVLFANERHDAEYGKCTVHIGEYLDAEGPEDSPMCTGVYMHLEKGGDVSIASEHMEYFQVIGNIHDAPGLLK